MKKILSLLLVVMTSVHFIQGQEGSTTSQDQPAEATVLKALSQVLDSAQSGVRYCPPPYTQILGECIYVHRYIPALTWNEAHHFCKVAGGFLAEPKYYGAIILHLFNTGMAKNIFDRIFTGAWLGGRRVGNGTTFEWSSGRPMEDKVEEGNAWYTYSDAGDCVMMILPRENAFHLRAVSCEAGNHFVCQLP